MPGSIFNCSLQQSFNGWSIGQHSSVAFLSISCSAMCDVRSLATSRFTCDGQRTKTQLTACKEMLFERAWLRGENIMGLIDWDWLQTQDRRTDGRMDKLLSTSSCSCLSVCWRHRRGVRRHMQLSHAPAYRPTATSQHVTCHADLRRHSRITTEYVRDVFSRDEA